MRRRQQPESVSAQVATHSCVVIDELQRRRFFLFGGVGDPQSLAKQLPSRSGERWFEDHHCYTSRDLDDLRDAARQAGADLLLTTEKDWVKLAPLASQIEMPIWRLELKIEFRGDGETRLLNAILDRISPTATRPNPRAG